MMSLISPKDKRMIEGTLNSAVLLGFVHQAIAQMNDPRQPSNATTYSVKDALLAAFSVFFMQCESINFGF